ncbi:LamG domain-containing protein [Terriglobus aquaticus]|uniref:LamG domain-containing protein n=1 Tax=Terriglobus aquaticus TaxID=940139 RepID=A0ABW9KHG9_9BACT|nr:LamG domain-containing protein [Terriglobus aquaticus]
MQRISHALGVLAALCFGVGAFAQSTTVTASNLKIGGSPITAGTVTIVPQDAYGHAIAFTGGDGSFNGPQPFSAAITNGAIAPGFTVPDQSLSTATTPNTPLWYAVTITNTLTRASFSYTLPPSTVVGSTFALDTYKATQFAGALTGTTNATSLPSSLWCSTGSRIVLGNGSTITGLYECYFGQMRQVPMGSGSGVTPTFQIGTVSTGAAAVQVVAGANNVYTLNFTLPQGLQGVQGNPGSTPSFSIGTVTTGAAGSQASVTVDPSSTPTNIKLDFTIPQGAAGTGGSGTSIALKVNGTANISQSVLNLIPGTNVSLSDNGSGGITVSVPAGSFDAAGAAAAALANAGVSTDSTKNGAVNLTYTGTAPLTPGANTVQQQQAVAVTTPYTWSMPGTPPPDSTHNVLAFTLANGVYVGSWVAASGGSGAVAGTIPGEWFFNEGTGTSSTNQGTGPVMSIANGSWVSQAGLSGGALAFNGSTNTSTQTVATAAGSSFSLAPGQAMGVCGFFSAASTGLYSRVIGTESSTGSSSGVSGWEFGLQNGAFFYEVAGTGGYNGNDSVSTTGGSYSANTLVFACANYNGSGTVTFYVNGTAQTTSVAKNNLTTSPASTGALTVGKLRGDTTTAAGNSVFSGNIGPLFIVIGRQFTTSEISTMNGNPYAKI